VRGWDRDDVRGWDYQDVGARDKPGHDGAGGHSRSERGAFGAEITGTDPRNKSGEGMRELLEALAIAVARGG